MGYESTNCLAGFDSYVVAKPASLTLPRINTINVTNVTTTTALVTWDPNETLLGYSLSLNGVETYRGLGVETVVPDLLPNTTYFVTVVGIGPNGVNGRPGRETNFTTTG